MEFDPIEHGLVVDGPSVGSPSLEGFEVRFAGTEEVGVVDEGEGNQFDRVDLDLPTSDAVPAARLHLGSLPQAERHRDVTRQHGCSKFSAELHPQSLGQTE
jgi:hypothetical protein